MKKFRKKQIWRVIIGLFALLLVINLGATLYFYQIACVRNNQQIGRSKVAVLIILWYKNSINYPKVLSQLKMMV